MAHGFIYLAAMLDWFSRNILSWKIARSDPLQHTANTHRSLSSTEAPPKISLVQTSRATSMDSKRSVLTVLADAL
jgi:hypothetical protein